MNSTLFFNIFGAFIHQIKTLWIRHRTRYEYEYEYSCAWEKGQARLRPCPRPGARHVRVPGEVDDVDKRTARRRGTSHSHRMQPVKRRKRSMEGRPPLATNSSKTKDDGANRRAQGVDIRVAPAAHIYSFLNQRIISSHAAS